MLRTSETIKRFYAINNQTKISPIYMLVKSVDGYV